MQDRSKKTPKTNDYASPTDAVSPKVYTRTSDISSVETKKKKRFDFNVNKALNIGNLGPRPRVKDSIFKPVLD